MPFFSTAITDDTSLLHWHILLPSPRPAISSILSTCGSFWLGVVGIRGKILLNSFLLVRRVLHLQDLVIFTSCPTHSPFFHYELGLHIFGCYLPFLSPADTPNKLCILWFRESYKVKSCNGSVRQIQTTFLQLLAIV